MSRRPGPTTAQATKEQQRQERIKKMRAEAKHYTDTQAEHFVYRCYDAEGQLLYVGCTQDVNARMSVHASSWQNPASAYLNLHMARHEVEPEPYIGRIAGRAAERQAIETERPLLNVHHNAGRGLPRRKVSEEELAAEMQKANEVISGWFAQMREPGAA